MDNLTQASGVLDLGAMALFACFCWLAAFTCFELVSRARANREERAGAMMLALATIVLGVLLWSADVMASLRLDPVLDARYDLRMTAVSLVVSLVVAGVAVSMFGGARGLGQAAFAGCVIGVGFGLAHYVGVAAVRVVGRVVIDTGMFALITLAATAIAVSSIVCLQAFQSLMGRFAASGVLAASALAFHASQGLALSFAFGPRVPTPTAAVSAETLFGFAGVVALIALAGSFAILFITAKDRTQQIQARDRAFADLTREGIVICEGVRIVDVNAAAARLVGLDPAVLRGRAFRDFLDEPEPDRALSASLAKPQEISLKSTGGESAFVEVSSRDVVMDGRSRRVFTLRDLSEQRRKEHQIRHLAYHDPLTGLANRAAFNEALASALKRGGEVALFCVDLDRFKEVNDVFGHSAGDDLLRFVASRIVAAAPDAMTFRLGGDEFVVIGTGPDAGDADKLALRITERLNTETVVAGRPMRCGASVGYAVYPHHATNVDGLFANADAALYRAKDEGRGLARGFEPDMDLALREKRALQQDLATAISRDEMFLHWMPQADTVTGEINGFEALIRWKHPTRGVVPPGQFIPVAEETAAIVPIGEWVLRTACQAGVNWTRPGKVAINLSPVQFQHGDIVELVHSILLETGLPASRLELEITEGVLLDDLAGALNTLRRLKALGVQIAMDDFGTGYSSLSYLQAFPFDRIKIDASFIRTLSTSPQAKAIVRAVVALGQSLEMPITAEGVETAEQRAFLAELKCEEIQGFLVGRPSPVVSFESPFARQRFRAAS